MDNDKGKQPMREEISQLVKRGVTVWGRVRRIDSELHNTIKGSPRVADGELPLHDRKTIAELKDMEWNSKTQPTLGDWEHSWQGMLFQLRLDKYNLKHGREDYTVSRIFEPDISHKQNASYEVEIQK
ncbi:hypothetical protein CFP56_026650, partial [Quercus suber]